MSGPRPSWCIELLKIEGSTISFEFHLVKLCSEFTHGLRKGSSRRYCFPPSDKARVYKTIAQIEHLLERHREHLDIFEQDIEVFKSMYDDVDPVDEDDVSPADDDDTSLFLDELIV
jgi:hypothetical protein